MFAGHIGAAMMLSKAERRLNLGVFVFAALMLDILLWFFVLLGWEHVEVPPDFPARRQLAFDFTYSHGLLASIGWSVAAVGLAPLAMTCPRKDRIRAAVLIGLAVFSHWLLDALVHRPELPVAGSASEKIGLSLWDHLPTALVLESLIAGFGLGVYLREVALPLWRRLAIGILSLLVVGMTIAGMTVAPPPPGAMQAAVSSLISIIALVALFTWFDSTRPR